MEAATEADLWRQIEKQAKAADQDHLKTLQNTFAQYPSAQRAEGTRVAYYLICTKRRGFKNASQYLSVGLELGRLTPALPLCRFDNAQKDAIGTALSAETIEVDTSYVTKTGTRVRRTSKRRVSKDSQHLRTQRLRRFLALVAHLCRDESIKDGRHRAENIVAAANITKVDAEPQQYTRDFLTRAEFREFIEFLRSRKDVDSEQQTELESMSRLAFKAGLRPISISRLLWGIDLALREDKFWQVTNPTKRGKTEAALYVFDSESSEIISDWTQGEDESRYGKPVYFRVDDDGSHVACTPREITQQLKFAVKGYPNKKKLAGYWGRRSDANHTAGPNKTLWAVAGKQGKRNTLTTRNYLDVNYQIKRGVAYYKGSTDAVGLDAERWLCECGEYVDADLFRCPHCKKADPDLVAASQPPRTESTNAFTQGFKEAARRLDELNNSGNGDLRG